MINTINAQATGLFSHCITIATPLDSVIPKPARRPNSAAPSHSTIE
jgi:hypothetical protein